MDLDVNQAQDIPENGAIPPPHVIFYSYTFQQVGDTF